MSEALSSLGGQFCPRRKRKGRMELQPVESLISCCLNFPLRRQPSPVSRIHSSSPPSLYKGRLCTRPDLSLQPLLQAPLPPWYLVSLVPHPIHWLQLWDLFSKDSEDWKQLRSEVGGEIGKWLVLYLGCFSQLSSSYSAKNMWEKLHQSSERVWDF